MRLKVWLAIMMVLLFLCISPHPLLGLELTLSEAIDMAVEHNEGILASTSRIDEAGAGVTIARSGFLPKISLQGSYTRLAELPEIQLAAPAYEMFSLPVYDPTTGDVIGLTDTIPVLVGSEVMGFKMGEEENYLGRVSLEQPLFTWGKLKNGYQISKLSLDAAKEDYRTDKNALVFDVTRSFYNILVVKEFIKVTEDAYRQIERHLKVVKNRYDEGLASKFDLLRAQVQLANMEPRVLKAKNGLRIAETMFKTILNLPQDTIVELKGELKYEPFETELNEAINGAQINRSEIKSLFLKEQMASKALEIAKKANSPNLFFMANYDYKKPLYFNNEWGKDWSFTVALQWPIFAGFGNFGEIQKASAQLSQAKHGLNLLKQIIETEVRAAYLQLEEAKESLESQKENVAQAEEALRIVEERYKTGLATSLEVMDTQLALTEAKTNQLQALSDYLISKASLKKAIGKERYDEKSK